MVDPKIETYLCRLELDRYLVVQIKDGKEKPIGDYFTRG